MLCYDASLYPAPVYSLYRSLIHPILPNTDTDDGLQLLNCPLIYAKTSFLRSAIRLHSGTRMHRFRKKDPETAIRQKGFSGYAF